MPAGRVGARHLFPLALQVLEQRLNPVGLILVVIRVGGLFAVFQISDGQLVFGWAGVDDLAVALGIALARHL